MNIFEKTPDVRAIFRFNGTRRTPLRDGYRPDHLIKKDYLTCGVHHYDCAEQIQPNSSASGTITFIAPEHYPHCLWIGKIVNIQEGAIIIGTAEITEIMNPILIADQFDKN